MTYSTVLIFSEKQSVCRMSCINHLKLCHTRQMVSADFEGPPTMSDNKVSGLCRATVIANTHEPGVERTGGRPLGASANVVHPQQKFGYEKMLEFFKSVMQRKGVRATMPPGKSKPAKGISFGIHPSNTVEVKNSLKSRSVSLFFYQLHFVCFEITRLLTWLGTLNWVSDCFKKKK